jgi:hypothetical protein
MDRKIHIAVAISEGSQSSEIMGNEGGNNKIPVLYS